MLDRILYYLIFVPLGYMPLFLIYLVSDLFYLIIRFIIPYRKKVVSANINTSFPDRSPEERKKIVRRFYRYFADLFAESIRNLFISKKALLKRISVRNPELMQELYDKQKNVILLSSHYNNWEFLISAQNLLFPFQAFGIGMPLSNKYWDRKITALRERFGMRVITAGNYKEELLAYTEKPSATLVLGDQNPGKNENCYWTTFLHQETAFFFGAEFMANEFDMAVVNCTIHRVRRGRYELELELLTEHPKEEPYGAVTERYIRSLEKSINDKPEFWLWSHKRWKKKVPENIMELKANHQKRFEDRFRN